MSHAKYNSYSEYLALPEFRNVVANVRQRSGGICETCKTRKATEPHHVRYCKWGDVDTPENLVDVCHECHDDAHRCDECGVVRLKARHIKSGVRVCDECRSR